MIDMSSHWQKIQRQRLTLNTTKLRHHIAEPERVVGNHSVEIDTENKGRVHAPKAGTLSP